MATGVEQLLAPSIGQSTPAPVRPFAHKRASVESSPSLDAYAHPALEARDYSVKTEGNVTDSGALTCFQSSLLASSTTSNIAARIGKNQISATESEAPQCCTDNRATPKIELASLEDDCSIQCATIEWLATNDTELEKPARW